ncbi:MAG TPA: hypothetical protein VGF34_01615 [Stellaceae bacterium]|jgi:hypothetical protein
MSETTTTDDLDEGWSLTKLRPRDTGLPMAVWVTENDGYPHDVRVKVSLIHGGAGSWRHDAVSVGVRPQPHEIMPGSLSAADFASVTRWIELNRQTIIDHWDGAISALDLRLHLRRLP